VPQLLYAAFHTNDNYTPWLGVGSNFVTVAFSAPMDPTMLGQISTYTVGGGVSILGVLVNGDNRTVNLMVSGVPSFPLNVTVNASLAGMGGGLPVGNTTVAVNKVPLSDLDIGVFGADPAVPGVMYVNGPQDYTIAAAGSDIWNAADGFNFAYEMKTNDFDVVVRQKDITHTSNWAKGGLMARETLENYSRNWNIINDPLASDGIQAADNSGLGASLVECNSRILSGGPSAAFDTGTRPAPAYPNAWVRLKRVGNVITAYASTDGFNWTLRATQDPTTLTNGDMTPLPTVMYVGLCTTAHSAAPTIDTYGALPYKYVNTVDYANYDSNYVPSPTTTMTTTVSGTNITITWTPVIGQLYSSPALSGPNMNWQPVANGTSGSVTLPMSGNGLFFKVAP
jgi:hypothetical protein